MHFKLVLLSWCFIVQHVLRSSGMEEMEGDSDRIRLSEESEMDGVGGSMRSFVDRRRRHAIERGDFGQRRAKWREYRKKKKKTSRCTGLFGCCHRKRKEQDREVSVSDDKTVEPSQDVDRSEAVIDLESGTKGGSDFDRPGYDVTWKHVRCQAPSGSPGQEILTNQHGEAKPNEILAIMGPSGSGRSTLLKILAGRVAPGKVTGTVYANGQPRTSQWTLNVGYVEHDDALFSLLTVRETLMFAAIFRLSNKMSMEEKAFRVSHIIERLGLGSCAESLIGDDKVRGISVGERRRVAIGVELLSDPRVLFLDEPTFGLDAATAFSLIETLRVIAAKETITMIMTLQQPREDIVYLFDHILLLAQGKMVFAGTVEEGLEHFKVVGYPCPDHMNPADFFIDALSPDVSLPNSAGDPKVRVVALQQTWQGELDQLATASSSSSSDAEETQATAVKLRKRPTWNNYWMREFLTHFKRYGLLEVRDRTSIYQNIGQALMFSGLVGSVFFRLKNTVPGAQARLASIFTIVVQTSLLAVNALGILVPFEKRVMERERAVSSYRVSSAYLARTITMLPLRLFYSLLFGVSVYYVSGFQPSASKFFTFQGILLDTVYAAVGFSLFVNIGLPSASSMLVFAPLFLQTSFVTGGALSSTDEMPAAVRWVQYLSITKYSYSALAQNEFNGRLFQPHGSKRADASSEGQGSGNGTSGEQILRENLLDDLSVGTCCYALLGLGTGFYLLASIALYIVTHPWFVIQI